MSRCRLWVVLVDETGEAHVHLKAEITRALPPTRTFRTEGHAAAIADRLNVDRPEVPK